MVPSYRAMEYNVVDLCSLIIISAVLSDAYYVISILLITYAPLHFISVL